MFCEYFNLHDLPTCTQTLCLYARFLSRTFKATQSIQNYLSGVKTLHVMLDLDFSNENIYQLNTFARYCSRKTSCSYESRASFPDYFARYLSTFEIESYI